MQEEKPNQKTKTGTEEETFRRLKRVDFSEVSYRFASTDDKVYDAMSDDEFEEFFNSLGWTAEEFNKENMIRFNRSLLRFERPRNKFALD